MNESVDPLIELASYFYATHRAIYLLGEKATPDLKNDLLLRGAEIVAAGGKITEGVNHFKERGPVVRNKKGEILSYGLGEVLSEQIIANVLAAPNRQA